MKIFIDESGEFSWAPPGVSLFCAVTVSDRTLSEALAKFIEWKGRQPNGSDSAELKGKTLSTLQQASFASSVVLESQGLCLTLAGTKTTLFKKEFAKTFIADSASILRATSRRAQELEKPQLVEHYRKMASWVEKRSPENIMWLLCLVDAIRLSIQHSIVLFSEDADACEFENIEIFMDRSFIHKPKHTGFWQDWLRMFLLDASLKNPLKIIRQWPQAHPFRRKYTRENHIVDMSEVYREHTQFVDSEEIPGVQVADICANISYRFFSGNRKYRPYRLLRSRIVGEEGSKIHYGILDESSLLKDAAENHVLFYSEEDLTAWAVASQQQRN